MTARRISYSPGRLAWFGLLAPPLAWGAQLVAGYSFEEAACGRPDSSLWGAGVDSLTAVVLIACACVALLGGIAALAAWFGHDRDERGIARFMLVASMLGCLVFLLAIVLGGIALASVNGCAAG